MPASDPGQLAAQMTAKVISAYKPSMDALGKDIQADMRKLISVPVEKVGSRVIRSKPTEAPRRESGDLSRSMETRTVATSSGVTTVMESNDEIAGYAGYLQNKLNRPHFSTIADRVAGYAADRILSRLPKEI